MSSLWWALFVYPAHKLEISCYVRRRWISWRLKHAGTEFHTQFWDLEGLKELWTLSFLCKNVFYFLCVDGWNLSKWFEVDVQQHDGTRKTFLKRIFILKWRPSFESTQIFDWRSRKQWKNFPCWGLFYNLVLAWKSDSFHLKKLKAIAESKSWRYFNGACGWERVAAERITTAKNGLAPVTETCCVSRGGVIFSSARL